MDKQFEGIYPAVLTPFANELALDLDRFASLVDHLYASGVNGVYVGGHAGEWYLQTLEERKQVIRSAVELSHKRGKVIVHVGCPRTEDAENLARFAANTGVDAIASLPPYLTRWTLSEVIQYSRQIASATDLPFLFYHFPSLTGVALNATLLDGLKTLPNLAGAKFTDMNLSDLTHLVHDFRDGFIVLNGQDQVFLPALQMGAVGGIGAFYNAFPEMFVSVFDTLRSGDLERAVSIQTEINRVIRIVKKYPLIPALRCVLDLQGLNLGQCRAPTLELSKEEQTSLTVELEQLGFLSGKFINSAWG